MKSTDDQHRILGIALALNFLMFVVGMAAGLLAHSASLIADSLDMLSDASAYGIGLLAIGRSTRFKSMAAWGSGVLLLILGLGVLIEVVRRAVTGSEPVGPVMIGIACVIFGRQFDRLAFVATIPERRGAFAGCLDLHARRCDCQYRRHCGGYLRGINGVTLPDLIIGLAIAIYVMKEAFEILGEAREAHRD